MRKPEPARFRNWQKEYVTADVANGVSLPWDEDYHEHDWAGAEFWENALEKATKEEEKAGERSEAASSAIRDHSFVAPNSSVSKRIDYASCCNCGSLLTPLGKYYANKTEKDSGYTDYECSDCVIAEVTHKGEPEKVN